MEGANTFKDRMQDDITYLKKEDSEFGIKRDYSPVVVSLAIASMGDTSLTVP